MLMKLPSLNATMYFVGRGGHLLARFHFTRTLLCINRMT